MISNGSANTATNLIFENESLSANNIVSNKSNIYYTFNDGSDKWSNYVRLLNQYDYDNFKSDIEGDFDKLRNDFDKKCDDLETDCNKKCDDLETKLKKTFTSNSSGMVPAPGSGKTSYFLRGDGTWQSIDSPSVNVNDALTIKSKMSAYNVYVNLLYSLEVYPSDVYKLKMSNGKNLCMFNINLTGGSGFIVANGEIELSKTLEIVSLSIVPTIFENVGGGTGFAAIKLQNHEEKTWKTDKLPIYIGLDNGFGVGAFIQIAYIE